MNKEPLEKTQDAISAPERLHESLVAVKPQEYSQQDFSVEHPLLQSFQISNSDESWASDFELSSIEGWNDFDDIEPHVSNANYGDGKIDQLEPSTLGEFEEIEHVDPSSVHGHGGLPHEPMYPEILRSGISMDTSRVPLDVQTQCRPCQGLNDTSTGPSETVGAVSVPGLPTDPGRPENGPGLPIPCVVVSDPTVNTHGIRSEIAVPALHTNIPSPTRLYDGTQTLDQNLRQALASGESTRNPSDNSRYLPNNYQIAYTLGNGDQPQFETPIAESVSDFYADADRTYSIMRLSPKSIKTLGSVCVA